MSASEAALSSLASAWLARRRPLELRPGAAIAIKRNAHELLIDAPTDRFAAALAGVLGDAERTFGAIRIKRSADRVGQRFEPGERFQGTVQLDALVATSGRASWLAPWLRHRLSRRVCRLFEELMASDFAMIESVGEHLVSYTYLSGSPLAGRSEYRLEPLGPNRCRLLVLFEYQELGWAGIELLHRFGIRLHDRAVAAQVEQAAAQIGARVLASTLSAALS